MKSFLVNRLDGLLAIGIDFSRANASKVVGKNGNVIYHAKLVGVGRIHIPCLGWLVKEVNGFAIIYGHLNRPTSTTVHEFFRTLDKLANSIDAFCAFT